MSGSAVKCFSLGALALDETGHSLAKEKFMETQMLGNHESTPNAVFQQARACYLERSGTALPPAVAKGAHLLVMIDHRLARIYKTEFGGSVPEELVPYDAAGAGRHLHHAGDESNGQREPQSESFYSAVAKTLAHAKTILLFGSGKGARSVMDQLLAELDRHNKHMRQRVIGSIVVDEQQLAEHQLLVKAREFYATVAASRQPCDADRLTVRPASAQQTGTNHHQSNGGAP
jgi:hypothetical protein